MTGLLTSSLQLGLQAGVPTDQARCVLLKMPYRFSNPACNLFPILCRSAPEKRQFCAGELQSLLFVRRGLPQKAWKNPAECIADAFKTRQEMVSTPVGLKWLYPRVVSNRALSLLQRPCQGQSLLQANRSQALIPSKGADVRQNTMVLKKCTA